MDSHIAPVSGTKDTQNPGRTSFLLWGTVSCFGFIFLIFIGNRYFNLPQIWFFWLILGWYGVWLGSYLKARTVTSYNHRFRIHPTSYIGQTWVKGKSNIRGYWWYMGFSIGLAGMPLFFGFLLEFHFQHLDHINIIIIFLYIGALGIFGQGVIPINLSFPGHILTTVFAFAGAIAMNIIMLLLFSNFGSKYPWGYRIPAIIQIICSIVYMTSYFTRAKPGFFQKLWVISFSFSFLFYGSIFSLYTISPPL
ncbi:MAG: hypothetical protein E4G98_04260 [Promethearchaeota archaeon]|nr:MAG: hypothetical protein E4G98_04260 [Candidatus Lokiarchaeota archaeon]